MSLIGRFMRRVRRDGLRGTLRALWKAAQPEILELYRLDRLQSVHVAAQIEVHTHIEELRKLRQRCNLLPDEFYCEGRPGFVDGVSATGDGALGGVIWVLRAGNASRYRELREGQAELSYLHVLAGARGRGIAKALYRRAASELLRSGTEDVFAVIAADNHAYRRAAEAVGFRWIASLRRCALWGRRFAAPVASSRAKQGNPIGSALPNTRNVLPPENGHSGSSLCVEGK